MDPRRQVGFGGGPSSGALPESADACFRDSRRRKAILERRILYIRRRRSLAGRPFAGCGLAAPDGHCIFCSNEVQGKVVWSRPALPTCIRGMLWRECNGRPKKSRLKRRSLKLPRATVLDPFSGCLEKPFDPKKTPADVCLLVRPQTGPSMFQKFSQSTEGFEVEMYRLIGIYERNLNLTERRSRSNVAAKPDNILAVRSHPHHTSHILHRWIFHLRSF
jgi:hypothetical protein